MVAWVTLSRMPAVAGGVTGTPPRIINRQAPAPWATLPSGVRKIASS